jgi:hypothetical protein
VVAEHIWVCPRLNRQGADAVEGTRSFQAGAARSRTNRHSRIDVNQDHELKYWSEKFGVSRDELRKAVHTAGPMVKDVQRHLNR